MSANSPGPDPEAAPDAEPTALATVFRRLAEQPAPVPADKAPEIIGFAEPVEMAFEAAAWTAPIEPFVPAGEDFAALAPTLPMALAVSEPEREPEPEPELEPPGREAELRLPAPPPELAIPQPRSRISAERLGHAVPSAKTSKALPHGPPPAAPARPEPAHEAALPRRSGSAPTAEASGARPALDGGAGDYRLRNRRLYRRAKLPGEIEIDGVPCSLIDVSVGGFAVRGTLTYAVNTTVPVTLRVAIDRIDVGTQLRARIIYANETRSSGRFLGASASQIALLRYLVTWRGESVGAAGATTLLDAIGGGPDSAGADALGNGVADAPKERWWAGLIGRKIASPR